jgi:DNA primase
MPTLTLTLEGLVYSLDETPSRHGKKTVLQVQPEGPTTEGRHPFVDRVDLYSFRSRRSFASLVAEVFGRQTGEVQGHLAYVVDHVERAACVAATKAESEEAELDSTRRKAAERLLKLKSPLDGAAQAMAALGYVGEERTKRLAYLVATSRLLHKPLSLILRAPSGCGKSELLDVVSRLLPPAAVEYLSRLTPQALYYAGADHLRHKLVVVDEQAGASEADYAIRTLQSKGLLRLAVPIKGKTEPFTVHGPVSVMSGTTSSDLNAENLSRCLEVTLDESPEQTRRVQEAQRRAWSGQETEPAHGVEAWRDAQRLLASRPVVIPYAGALDFPARTSADRRGNQKLLGLIASHALLCQRRRATDERGRIVATQDDYRIVHDLLRPEVERDLDGLSPRAARAYRLLVESSDRPLTRRETAGHLGWGYNTAKRALLELVDHELATISDRGPPARYWVLDASVLGSGGRLVAPAELKRACA